MMLILRLWDPIDGYKVYINTGRRCVINIEPTVPLILSRKHSAYENFLQHKILERRQVFCLV
jgi:hypothetical protein